MTAKSSSAASVEYRHNVGLKRHELGVKIEGTFVPFATLADAMVAQLTENAKNLAGEGEPASEGEGE